MFCREQENRIVVADNDKFLHLRALFNERLGGLHHTWMKSPCFLQPRNFVDTYLAAMHRHRPGIGVSSGSGDPFTSGNNPSAREYLESVFLG
ncbi:hypothetical protein EBZ80_19195 [bacterium]|nr:hypothetical protein [bacterium]